MKKSNVLVYGIGIKGMEYHTTYLYKRVKEYDCWIKMLCRCTEKLWEKYPTYKGVTCSENFKSYSYFYEWCQTQVGFGNVSSNGRYWQLDKDLLVRGNKVYSEDTCVFIPPRINSLLIKSDSARGEYPIGVSWHKHTGKFASRCSIGCKTSQYLGIHDTAQEAFQAYKTYKEALIKEVANEYKEQLDSRVYEALMNYEVNEND